MLPFLIPLAATSLLGAGQGIANALSDQNQQRANKNRLDRLLARQKQGNLGLSDTQQQLLDRQLVAPVAQQAATQRSRAEQIQASMGSGASGADLARLRGEQASTNAAAAQNAALQVRAADQQAKQAQRNEIEQRLALQTAQRQGDLSAIFGGASQMAGAAGALAGAPPEVTRMYGMFGSQLAPEEQSQMADFAEKYPEEFGAMWAKMLRKSSGLGTSGTGEE